MNLNAALTPREEEVAEYFAWGATKKDVANRLHTSVRTVETQARAIFEKSGVNKVNELAAWWFCRSFQISLDLSPFKRAMVACSLLFLLGANAFLNDDQDYRRARSSRCTRVARTFKPYES